MSILLNQFIANNFFNGIGDIANIIQEYASELNDLTDPKDAPNLDYVQIMANRTKLFVSAEILSIKIFPVTCPNSKSEKITTLQTEYAIRTAGGEIRYFFAQPLGIFQPRDERIICVFQKHTSIGKPVHTPEDYLTNPLYRRSFLPVNTVEPVRTESAPPQPRINVHKPVMKCPAPVYVEPVAKRPETDSCIIL